MDNDPSRNSLIGMSLVDTLANISAVMMLLKYFKFSGDINESAEHGLFLIYTVIQNALEYEIEKTDLKKT